MSQGNELEISEEIAKLEARAQKLLEKTYAKLSPWQKAQVARHPDRPHVRDYIDRLIDDWTPLTGDRLFGEDRVIQGGLGRFRGHRVVVLGQEKGADTDQRIRHNFGMARPEGYRKAVRLMRLAERFGLPVLCFVDTKALKLTAQDLLTHGVVDRVVPEPLGGAHRGRATTMEAVGEALADELEPLLTLDPAERRRRRRDKFLAMGRAPEKAG